MFYERRGRLGRWVYLSCTPQMPERRIGLVKQTYLISYHLDAVIITKMTDSFWWIWAYTESLGPNSDRFCCT
jgi:hypothetical protein